MENGEWVVICIVDHVLDNPVFNALLSGDWALSSGTEYVRYFDPEVSPFVGFPRQYKKGFDDLHELLPEGRQILYATTGTIEKPGGWQLLAEVKGLQFVYEGAKNDFQYPVKPVPLSKEHVREMVDLATLTRPGPFATRTIEFGHYFGIFENDRLVSMTGQRLHVENYSEISAVCTHPDYLGKGYAANLLQHQLKLICSMGQVPFLHVRDDNERAISLYHRLGFKISRPMNFYFMMKQ